MSLGSEIGGAAFALESGYDYSATALTPIASSATAHTVGAYVELLSAANNTYPLTGIEVLISMHTSAGNDGNMLFNLAIGGAGSEQIIVGNMLVASSVSTSASVSSFNFPIELPAGERISINCQSEITGVATMGAGIIATSSVLGLCGLSVVNTIGATAGTTRGTLVTTSGTIDTFGSWIEISASLAENYKGFIIAASKATGSWSTMELTYQVAIGSAGNEVIVFSGQHMITAATEYGVGLVSSFKNVELPAGERISIRAQASSTNSDRNLDYVVYGVR